MLRFRSYVQRLMVMLALCVIIIAGSSYLFSTMLVRNTYVGMSRQEMAQSVQLGVSLLEAYARGEVDKEELDDSVNPHLNLTGVFMVLLDGEGKLLACTEGAPAGAVIGNLPRNMPPDTPQTVNLDKEHLVLGQKCAQGTVLTGKPLTGVTGAVESFRNLLLQYVLPTSLVVLAGLLYMSHIMSKPSDIIVEAAQRISQGQLVQVTTPLPPDLKPVGRAFNDMSKRLSEMIGELRYERDLLRVVLEGLREGVLAMDATGEMLHENKASETLLGGKGSKAYAQVCELLRASIDTPAEPVRIQRGEKTLLVSFTLLPERPGYVRGAMAMILDVTEAERLERTRRDYVANISHELRTPLTSMRGIAEGLRDGLVTEENDRQRYYDMIVNEIMRLSRLVNDLLELSSLQSNPAAFEMEKVECEEAVYEVCDRTVAMAQKKGLTLMPEIAPALPYVLTNEDRLQQVLTILIDNAIKFTPAGGSVTVCAQHDAKGVRFSVRDTGVGMDEYTRRHAFERFHQADVSHKSEGSGLGLSIAREVLEKLGTRIYVISAQGKGSEFYFVLPVWQKK